MCMALTAAAWGLSYFDAYLNELHRFPDTVHQILSWVEIILVVLDVLVFLGVLLLGVRKFFVELGDQL